MTHLADTIARLAALRAGQAGATPGPDVPALDELTGFGANPGALSAFVTVPPGLKPGAPLVVVLHGCKQTAAGYDHAAGWSVLARRHGFAVLFPEQRRGNNPNHCFNWFEPGDVGRGGGEVASIAAMIEAVVAGHRLDRARIFVTGLSAGGAMTCAMLGAYPDLFAAGATIAGLPYASAGNVPEAFQRMGGRGGPSGADLSDRVRNASAHAGPWPRLSVWQGSADHTVAPSNAAAIVEQWRLLHGLDERPSASESLGPHRRLVWRDAQGRDAIEEYTIVGMGHGTPLDGALLGNAAPYMLDVGLSSTLRIAHFFGVVPEAALSEPLARRRQPAPEPETAGWREIDPGAGPAQQPQRPRLAARSGGAVRRTIEDALRQAGLMR